MIDVERLLIQIPITSRIAIAKTLATFLAVCAYFCSGVAFYAIISSVVGIGYYLLLETHPQAMIIVHMILHYRYTRAKNCVLWRLRRLLSARGAEITQTISKCGAKLETLLRLDERRVTPTLEYDDDYSSIVYNDNCSNALKTPQSKQFVYLFHEKHRSNDLIVFKDENDKDVTDDIERYLGPLQNFHGSPLTPKDLGHQKISVFREGQINMVRTFQKDEPITFTQ